MSIVLKAFPMGFLISPDAKNNKISPKKYDLSLEKDNLKLVKVATNLTPAQIPYLMANLDECTQIDANTYQMDNGLNIHWELYNGHYCAVLSMGESENIFNKITDKAQMLVRYSETLFNTFDVILKKNTRDVGSEEIFYYCYNTAYKTKGEVLELLKNNNIENISKQTETEIRFRVNNKNYKYIRPNKQQNFYLESEQKIPLVNIVSGQKPITSKAQKTNYTYKETLIKTLDEHGATNIISDEFNVTCEMFGMKLHYSKDFASDAYNLEIMQITDQSECEKLLKDLDEEYGLNIQDLTYRKILERIKDKNMRLESEEVGDDNSIVLTIDLG